MFKKGLIFFFLFSAYTVLLAHNFTPHHHHIEQTTHHHDHDHHDDHEGDNQKNAFHFFQHIGAPGIEFISGQFIKYDHQKKLQVTAFINLANTYLSDFEKPPLIVALLQSRHISFQQSMPYFFLLKAPPVFTT